VEIVRTLARKSELSGAIRADGAFKDVKPKGTLLVEVQGTLARHFLMPSLFEFFVRYPEIELSMSESDRWVDLVREGVDCVLRFGNLPDSDMVARRVGMLSGMTCAAPWSRCHFCTRITASCLPGCVSSWIGPLANLPRATFREYRRPNGERPGTQLNLGLGVRERACRGTGTSPKGQTRLTALVVTIRPNLEGRNPCGV
jgi:DNA-binding transcriptional LysR family regulator